MGRVFPILAVVLGCACLAAPAQADFGFSEFEVSFRDGAGAPETRAGSHPFVFETAFEVNVDEGDPDGQLKNLSLDLPPGLVFDRNALPSCAQADFETLDDGFNDCPDVTAVGLVSAAVGEAGDGDLAPVYNLVPQAGELMRLGFRVGGVENVVVSAAIHPEQPHEMTFEIEDFAEAVELFGLELQLWGVPADPAHDDLRGRCAGPEGSLGSCPAAVVRRPLLTLPTHCGEPLEVSYWAESWDEMTASGGALTHDEAENPMGMSGCGALSFSPELTVQPTTESAQSPTGLEITLGFSDEGLINPDGIAESQLRDLFVALPEGLDLDSSAGGGLGVCSASDLSEEGPDSAPGDGCPGDSQIGTLEVESPLLGEEVLSGAVYLATPLDELAPGTLVELYAVVRSAALGIVVKQTIEVEPEGGQLVAYAEDLPQLPFSRLDLDLFAGDSPLVTPPGCGDYEIEAELTPWADNGDYLLTSEFSLESGPGGGPCSSGEGESSSDDPSPAMNPPSVVAVIPPPVRRLCPRGRGAAAGRCLPRCPKGKRAVRRKGKRVCIRRCRKGKRVVRRRGKLRCVKVKKRTHRKHRRRGR